MLENLTTLASPLIVEGSEHEDMVSDLAKRCIVENSQNKEAAQKKVDKNAHPDWLQCEGQLKMEDLRSTLYQLHHKAFDCSVRVLSITNFQDASSNIQNALLKTLEEPHKNWRIFLGVKSIYGVLSTIRSRCLLYKMPSSDEDVSLSESDSEIFEAIERGQELSIYKSMEGILANRERAKQSFSRLLIKASSAGYPGHWQTLAPLMERSIDDLNRNLNPRNVWEKIWLESRAESH